MILSRAWYVLLGVAVAVALYVVYVAVGQFNRQTMRALKEGLASDMVFDGTTTRTIHVDARYMLWTMDRLDGADHLVKELGIEPKL